MNEKIYVYTLPVCPKCKMVKEWLNKNNLDYEELYFDTEIQGAYIMNNIFGNPPIVDNGFYIYTSENLFNDDILNEELLENVKNEIIKVRRKRDYYLGYIKCPICCEKGELHGQNTVKTNTFYYAYVQHFHQKGGRGAKKTYTYKCYLGKVINGIVKLPNGGLYRVDNKKKSEKNI